MTVSLCEFLAEAAHGKAEAFLEQVLEVVRIPVSAVNGDLVYRIASGLQQMLDFLEAERNDRLADACPLQFAEAEIGQTAGTAEMAHDIFDGYSPKGVLPDEGDGLLDEFSGLGHFGR